MIPRPITRDEVRVGDRVRWQQRDEPDAATIIGRVTEITLGGQWLDIEGWPVPLNLHGYVLILLDRPTPPIPTTPGTVIRSKEDGTIWVRTADGGGRWASWGMDWEVPDWTPDREGHEVMVPEQDGT